jgi:hypothetical protein
VSDEDHEAVNPEPDEAAQDPTIRVSSTSRYTAAVDPIVLRTTTTTRLVFRPVLLENTHNPEASMDGAFIFERKTPSSTWEEINELPLTRLRGGEGVKLDLKAAELQILFAGLRDYYDLVGEHGIPSGTRRFVRAPESQALMNLLANETKFRAALNDDELATALLQGLVAWIASNERAVAAARFDGISLEDLQQFDAVLGLARLQQFCRQIEENMGNGDEAFWQRTLESNGWAIAQVFAIPTMLVESQVYVGGKKLTNRGGNTADFLYENQITGNVVVVEIKTPTTALVGAEYRNNVYPPSEELNGGMAQILHNRRSLTEHYASLVSEEMRSQQALNPRGLLIVGSATTLTDHPRREGFEQWRNNQREVDVVTFDELKNKVDLMVNLLENATQAEG